MYEKRIAKERKEDSEVAKQQGREAPPAAASATSQYSFYTPTPLARLPDRLLEQKEHRRPLPFTLPIAAVSRKVPQAEMLANKDAKASVDLEWNKLRFHPHPGKKKLKTNGPDCGVWDELSVREERDVKAEAKRTGGTVHFGRIAQLC